MDDDDDEEGRGGYFGHYKKFLRNLPDNLILFYIFGEYVEFVPILSCNNADQFYFIFPFFPLLEKK